MARQVIQLGPYEGVYQPDYQLEFFRDGDPRKQISAKRLNLAAVTSITTSKSLLDLSGTFTISSKDGRARHVLREMDTVRIRMRGHGDPRYITVLKGVLDDVDADSDAGTSSAQEDTVVQGRCAGKYLQVTSLFLPVWNPGALLPTALTFGLGDASKKVGGNRPYDIFRYLVRKYTYGIGAAAGESGIPNSQHWIDHQTRFAKALNFQVPFLQFDETSVMDALKQMEVLGFTETWVDELGRVVYRQPGWDQPVAYQLHTDHIVSHKLSRTDVDTATYVEVIPAGDPGIDSATAQALRAGRAPVPSSYLGNGSQLGQYVSPEFVVATDSNGKPTSAGLENRWYKLQRRLGVRPQQVTSPLIFTQQQAQAQAEGLLRFLSRMQKGGTVTIPGDPRVRLGHTLQLVGALDGVPINRTFYIEAVSHDFQWGSQYTTTLTLSHGRDPWDPHWRSIVLPKFDAAQLASGDGGVLAAPTGQPAADQASGTGNIAELTVPSGAPQAIAKLYAECNRMASLAVAYQYGGGHGAYTPGGPWDCSGAVSQALHHAGLLTGAPLVSGDLASWGSPGQGAYFTVYANATHCFLKFPDGSCWGTSSAGAGGGVAFCDHPTQGFAVRHWPGL